MNNSFFDFELFAVPEKHFDKIEGQGRSGIFVLYTIESDGLSEQEYLSAILKPEPLSLDLQKDTFFLALQTNEAFSIAAIMQKYDPKYILLFGCDPKEGGIRLQLTNYQPITFQGKHFLSADSLHQIRSDREKNDNRRASALWTALKQIFVNLNQESKG